MGTRDDATPGGHPGPHGNVEPDRIVTRRRSLGNLLALLEDARDVAVEVVGDDRRVLEAIDIAVHVVRDSTLAAAARAFDRGDLAGARSLLEPSPGQAFDAKVSALLDKVIARQESNS